MKIRFLIPVCVFTAFAQLPAQAGPIDFLYHQYVLKRQKEGFSVAATRSGEFDQKLDPSDPSDARTFKQRYFIDSEFAGGGDSPVIYVICGEGTCSEREFRGEVADQARSHHAHLVALEHRYYGKSQPFTTLAAENLKYLRTDFALEDLAAFQKYAMKELGLKGKWVSAGGSYSGALSAFYRLKHPDLVVGALASSAPVRAKADFEEYDLAVATAAGPECAAVMRTVVKQIEDTLSDQAKIADMKATFGSQDVKDNVDFLFVVADMGATAVQYGFKDSFCSALTRASDPVKAYADAGQQIFSAFGLTPRQDSSQGAESINPDDYLGFAGMRQWLYQTCTEYGFYQVAYHDPAVSVRSRLIDMAFNNKVCERIFGIKDPVDASRVNHDYYEPLLDAARASRILFTNGSVDPWSRLSISKELGNDVNAGFSYFTIDGGAHCDDLGASANPAAVRARDVFSGLLDQWVGGGAG